jgi:hypothetical protein
MRLMRWAKRWQRTETWRHRLRVMCGYDAERIDYHWQEVPIDRLAKMWKSHLSESAYEQTGSSRGANRRRGL